MASLPLLPGNTPNKHLGKEKFHKSHHFDISNGVTTLAGDERPGIGGELLLGQKHGSKYSVYPQGKGCELPSWVAFDKQALCFDAYFEETVPQAKEETYRIRKCKIFFFLEDDTIKVIEPECKNSGITQGTFIRRHRIPLPPPNDDQFYNVSHFNINQEIILYSRKFIITDCDTFTRNFITNLGVCLNEPKMSPMDTYTQRRDNEEKSMRPLRPYERYDTLQQFLDYDNKVLRFYGYWDDTNNMYGDVRNFVLHYFLADDTIEIREVFNPNCGRNQVSKFLRRSKLPKAPSKLPQPGVVTDRTILNVFDSSNQGKRYILDSLKTGAIMKEFYKDCDLMIGSELNSYYRCKYGIEDFTPVQYKAPAAPKPFRHVPPYNGFGSEEDSLSSCQGLLPKPPQKDFHKFMAKDRNGLESNVLNFVAKMVTEDPVDKDRVFNISFYLSDDTISVFERTERNSGLLGGKFLERGRVKKPGQELYKSELSKYFTAQDFYVGAVLCLNNQNFQLTEADEYTFKYMEKHAEEFPRANVGSILSKLRPISDDKQKEIQTFLALSDPGNFGFIPYESFRGLLMGLECGLSEHEVLVLARCFSKREQSELDVSLMLAVAQDFLRKKHFEDFCEMTKAFTYHDRHKTGRLSLKETRTICKAFHLPLPENLLTSLLQKFSQEDEIDYQAYIAGINWLEYPAAPVMPDDIIKVNFKTSNCGGMGQRNVNYASMLKDIFSGPLTDPTTVAS
ncbi:hypothetical protein WMY93_028505 [Mugilogobius chulae]|uniref:EF-hand domain-containing family member C2 n=1 Tax=Mugilogobius chulae TaxID=88201 RepID=A0AAW0MUR0_9GOBI